MSLHRAPGKAEGRRVYVGCVWIVAKHLLVAQALAAALSREVADVRGMARDSRALDEQPIDGRQDLLLVIDDLRLESDVAEVRSLVGERRARTLVMTTAPRGPLWGGVLELGDVEVMSEPATTVDLAAIIQQVCDGVPVMTDEERAELVDAWCQLLEEQDGLAERVETLSPRELLVLRSLASGRRANEIGDALGVAESTVRTHIRSIRRKLEVDSQLRAVLAFHRSQSPVLPEELQVPLASPDGRSGHARRSELTPRAAP